MEKKDIRVFKSEVKEIIVDRVAELMRQKESRDRTIALIELNRIYIAIDEMK